MVAINARQRNAAIRRGGDASALVVALFERQKSLREEVCLLTVEADSRGVEVDAECPVPDVAVAKIVAAGCRYFDAVQRMMSGPTSPTEPADLVEDVNQAALSVKAQCHGVAWCLEEVAWEQAASPGDLAEWNASAVPSLLAVEHLDSEIMARLTALFADDYARLHEVYVPARRRLLSALEPHLRTVRPQVRAELERMIAEGRAPSPFGVMRRAC